VKPKSQDQDIFNKSRICHLKYAGYPKKCVGQIGRTLQPRFRKHIQTIRINRQNSNYAHYIVHACHIYGTIYNAVSRRLKAGRADPGIGIHSWVGSHESRDRNRRSKSEVGVGGQHSAVLSCIVILHYQATTSEDKEVLMFAVVICRVCRLVKVL
jgi:hypothetical protein